jgi:hypothetical protein
MEKQNFDLELDKAQQYIDFLQEYFGNLKNHDEHGGLVLSENQVSTFAWMLAEAGGVIHELNKDEGLKLAA